MTTTTVRQPMVHSRQFNDQIEGVKTFVVMIASVFGLVVALYIISLISAWSASALAILAVSLGVALVVGLPIIGVKAYRYGKERGEIESRAYIQGMQQAGTQQNFGPQPYVLVDDWED